VNSNRSTQQQIENKGFIRGKKKAEMGITEIGITLLNTKRQELE
jgi:hypothetical protein